VNTEHRQILRRRVKRQRQQRVSVDRSGGQVVVRQRTGNRMQQRAARGWIPLFTEHCVQQVATSRIQHGLKAARKNSSSTVSLRFTGLMRQ
jgi:hypothetical protein